MSRNEQPDHASDPKHAETGAEDRAHGAHGKGDTREALHQQGRTQPEGSHATPAAGDSTVERRSEPRGKDKKKKR